MHRPRLQLALDMLELPNALRVTEQVGGSIDVIEVGTLLCLSEGMNAIRTMRSKFPEHTIVGDVRIVRAGKNIAEMTFDAGADWVSVVGEAPYETIEGAAKAAEKYQGEIQIELSDTWTSDQVQMWLDLGIRQVIYHSTSEVVAIGGTVWTPQAFDTIRKMTEQGLNVSVTGGIQPDVITGFNGISVFVFIAGRAICDASDPASAAKEFQDAIAQTYA